MRAVLLAGGRGTRLRPYTTVLPKPLMPIMDKPILEIVVRQLQKAGFEHITFAVGYLAELIQAVFSDGRRFGLTIDYSFEEHPLGTAGPLSLIDPPTDDFLVMNGDILTNLDFADFIRAHRAYDAVATIAVFNKAVPISLGILEIDDHQRVVGYTEKPTLFYPVSTGIYCFSPRVLKFIPRNSHFDLPDLIRRLFHESIDNVRAYRFDGYWLDIGRPEDYEVAVQQYEKGIF